MNKNQRIIYPYHVKLVIMLFLLMATLSVFWQLGQHAFTNFDDNVYVTNNPHVLDGWSVESIQWAFTSRLHGHWHPVTWLSHMTDIQLFGLNPGAHHLVSLMIHMINTLLLFLILQRMTGCLYRSAFAAALFAIHPLHVETVAWIADRKDVLAAFFMLLAIGAYIRYVEKKSITAYGFIVVLFALGLMSKSMVITLPLILILIDLWPLGRINIRQPAVNLFNEVFCRIREKAGLFVIAGIFVFITIFSMKGLTVESKEISQYWGADFLINYISYIKKMLWPLNLTVYYPYWVQVRIWQIVLSGIILVIITVLCLFQVPKRPYLITGWLWFLVSLAPVIGVIKGGPHKIADRYTYIPLIGLFIIIAWGAPDMIARWRYRKILFAASGAILLFLLGVCAWKQTGYWKNSVTLFKRAVDIHPANYVAHNNLGDALSQQGDHKAAISHYVKALKIKPDYATAYYNMGNTFELNGRSREAIFSFLRAIKIKSHYAEAHNNLGVVLARKGNFEQAIIHFSKAIEIKPEYKEAQKNLNDALKNKEELAKAVQYYMAIIKARPGNANAHNNLGVALARQGKTQEAINHFSEALRIEPGNKGAKKNLERCREVMARGDVKTK